MPLKQSVLRPLIVAALLAGCGYERRDLALSPGDGSFTVRVLSGEVTLEAGGTAAVTVALDRSYGFSGDVDVSVTGLPAGVTADPLGLQAAQSSAALTLRSGSSDSGARVPVTVKGTSGSRTSSARFILTLVGHSRAALIPESGAVFVGERARLTPIFDGDDASIDGIGPVHSGATVETAPLSQITTFRLRVGRSGTEVDASTTVQANYRNRIRVLASAPIAQTNHVAAALPDGRAIAMGGNTSASPSVPDSTLSQIFDPGTEAFTAGPDLLFTAEAQLFTSISRLSDGGFLLVGTGVNGAGGHLPSVITQLFDPVAGFTRVGDVSTDGISFRGATSLLDGGVLVTGGLAPGTNPVTNAVDRYEADGKRWRAVRGMLQVRVLHTATLLHDGRVLIAGGLSCCQVPDPSPEFFSGAAEIHDPATDAFTSTGSMKLPRGGHAAALLFDGRVLISGGNGNDPDLGPLNTEIFDPATGEFTPGGDLQAPRDSHSAVTLTDGRVLVIGGEGVPQLAGRVGVGVRSTEIFDPAQGRWSAGPTLDAAFYQATVTMLRSGKVLIFGGQDAGGFPQAAVALFE
jgi:hypothetical protein